MSQKAMAIYEAIFEPDVVESKKQELQLLYMAAGMHLAQK